MYDYNLTEADVNRLMDADEAVKGKNKARQHYTVEDLLNAKI